MFFQGVIFLLFIKAFFPNCSLFCNAFKIIKFSETERKERTKGN